MSLLEELKRRNVIKVALLYLVTGWLVLQAADVVLPLAGVPDWGLRLVLVILGLGFVPALVVSWIWEITPEGIKRESEIDRSRSITHATGRKINVVIIVMLALAIGLLLAQTLRQPPSPKQTATDAAASSDAAIAPHATDARPSIAVLPFVNMSPDPDNAYFADGLSETLLHVLSQVNELKVAARTSSFSFKDKKVTVQQMGQTLGVETVLEGSVQRAGDRIRVIAQLVEVEGGSHLWSRNFDRTLEDIFAIQDEIATEVVKALKVTLLGGEQQRLVSRQTTNLEAYREYILGQQQLAQRQSAALDRAEAHFKRALELDPDYALAYVGLGSTYNLMAEYSDLSRPEAIAMIGPLVEEALKRDPESAEAYALKGSNLNLRFDNEGAEAAFLKAIELNPNHATAFHWFGGFLRGNGRFEEALRAIRRAQELDPLSDVIQLNVAISLWAMGQNELAVDHLKEQLRRNPSFPGFSSTMAGIERVGNGNMTEALRWYRRMTELDPGNVNFQDVICDVMVELDALAEATRCIDEVAAIAGQRVDPLFSRAVLLLIQGRDAEAMQSVQQVIERAPDNPGGWGFKALILARAGRFDEAMEAFARANPEIVNSSGAIDRSNWFRALNAAALFKATGNDIQMERLLAGVEQVISGMSRTRGFGYGWADASVHALRDDHEAALNALEAAYAEGVRNGWHFLRIDPTLRELWGTPRFQALIAQLETDMARQRARAEAEGLL